jgi:transposase-like protein
MDAEKYSRQIMLTCPTCGASSFETIGQNDGDKAICTCTSCGRSLSKDELIELNSENVQAHVDEVKKMVVEDITNEFRKIFSGTKFRS